ncbi:MAG: hypothetical protein ACREKJ_04180 [Candidatus Rokuibacteriota bacterium]
MDANRNGPGLALAAAVLFGLSAPAAKLLAGLALPLTGHSAPVSRMATPTSRISIIGTITDPGAARTPSTYRNFRLTLPQRGGFTL